MVTMKSPAAAFHLPVSEVFTSIRDCWRRGVTIRSAEAFAFLVSLTWLAIYNGRFWGDTVHAMWHGDGRSLAFLLSLGIVVLCLQSLLLLLLPRRLLKFGTSLLFMVAAIGSYFSATYGVIMNSDMLRNVLQTDVVEAGELLNAQLVRWIALLGVAPAIVVWKLNLPQNSWRQSTMRRVRTVAGILAACALALFMSSSSYASFFREHKPIRFMLSPAAPVASLVQLFADRGRDQDPWAAINASGAAVREAWAHRKPLLIVFMVGETARAADFQLGGYARPTNPRLNAEEGLIYFDKVTSCGTATAISVPCMFSHLGRDDFDVDDTGRYLNLLDSLADAGFDIEWRDNNAGCKGVCARISTVSYSSRDESMLCEHDYCYDEILLEGIPEKLRNLSRDTVIVMHMIGSHGPAYSQRYPPAFESFRPACRSSELQRCSTDEIVNAYDNTILYTDYVVSRAIDELRSAAGTVDSVLLYVSDHGESLGEQGIYLHGLPYRFAPPVQTHVPMLLWTSPGYAAARQLDSSCVHAEAMRTASHDNLYHTLLGAAAVRNASYDARLDLIGSCAAPLARGHE